MSVEAALQFVDTNILVYVWSEDLNPGQAYQGVHVVNPFVATT